MISALLRKINTLVEQLFQKALKGNRTALFIVSLSKYINKTAYGVWLFRKGDISKSLTTLKKIKKPNSLALKCINRSEDILLKLSSDIVPHESIPWHKPFNGNVLFALHSNGFYHANGYAVRSMNVINALEKNDISVFLLNRPGYPWDLAETAVETICSNITFENKTFNLLYDPDLKITGPESDYLAMYVQYLRERALRDECTVIHAHSSYLNGLAAAQVAKELQIKSCYEVRGLWHLSRALKEPAFENSEHYQYCERMELQACHSVNNVFTLSKTLKCWLVEHGIPDNKITVVPNGAESTNTPTCETSNSNTQYTLTLGFIGSITEYEGLELVLKALFELKDLDIHMLIAGSGSNLAPLQSLSEKLNLTSKVSFLGKVPKSKICELYKQIDIIVVNRIESKLTKLVSPLKHIEAFSYGVPCIVSNLPPLTEAAIDNFNSIVVKPNSVDSVKQAIQSLYTNKALLNELKANAKKIMTSEYNWQTIAQKYINTYCDKQAEMES